ncbi:dual specificity protein phosphatase 18 [Numenius arquata]|uniref:dual specificity protein phosphatase 18 n=1 Tax=Numenius arquata TaxID=31919 RepID=UPI003D30BBA1
MAACAAGGLGQVALGQMAVHVEVQVCRAAPAPWITSNLYLSVTVATNSHLLLFTYHISTIINISLERGDTQGMDTAPPCCWVSRSHHLLVLPPEAPLHVPSRRPHLDQVLPSHRTTQQWLLAAAHPAPTQTLWCQQAPNDHLSIRDEPQCL